MVCAAVVAVLAPVKSLPYLATWPIERIARHPGPAGWCCDISQPGSIRVFPNGSTYGDRDNPHQTAQAEVSARRIPRGPGNPPGAQAPDPQENRAVFRVSYPADPVRDEAPGGDSR